MQPLSFYRAMGIGDPGSGKQVKSKYVRLHGEEEDELKRVMKKKKRRTIRIGGGNSRARYRLRIKMRPRVRTMMKLLLSPVKLLKKLRDAYVSMMISLAEKGDFSGAVMGNTIYLPKGAPCRALDGIDSRAEDEMLAYIDFLQKTGRLVLPLRSNGGEFI